MLRFKKRIRLLTEKLGGSVEYGNDDSLTVRFDTGSVKFTPTSYESMTCSIDLGDGTRTFPLPKRSAFDILDRLSSPHLVASLRDYPSPLILQLDDYINDEQGEPFLRSLREQIAANPSLGSATLGGNRILAEYYHGVLILRDDLVMAGTNVIDF